MYISNNVLENTKRCDEMITYIYAVTKELETRKEDVAQWCEDLESLEQAIMEFWDVPSV